MYIEQHSRYQNKANNIQLRYDDKQFHTTVIKDVLLWIEHNLDQSLLLDDVANKAGYTKWYFQRLLALLLNSVVRHGSPKLFSY
ncbi:MULTISPECIES: hypothetical protein [Vibrio]|uniref:hypothetical protein n=1 Tax=Vibrio TaxID=662 RepID=UPI0019D45E43|nr:MULTISPECIES: hypothetical protein [Vibrio]MBN8114942.1 hypothetical protein [Vibrio vulnificus]MDF5019624.1 hypothetical protein [Vibrio parahaemolyticus]MDF5098823.1 hypothetical protein [Vibrio parahaemolyticus]